MKTKFFTVDFINKEIRGSERAFNRAGRGFEAELKELTTLMSKHEGFKLVESEGNKNKNTYEGLDAKFIRDYITLHDANQFKNLKFERMEEFMSSLPRGDEYKAEYKFLRYYAGVIQTNKYALVRKWFVAQFPEFRKNPLIYLYEQPEVLNAKEFADKEVENTELQKAS